ncbi:hypothetical protein GCM10007884_51540 [Methylobacterium brachythecii]|uniref:Uncharacterized protein n=1 Tax=Methylobacterium brachythecii TaxID=1176177 RepID=A0ABQ6D9V2_9HYPH|nr:hypothetical protein GCM10007884_51540 [Methylobacterium brachythecii]
MQADVYIHICLVITSTGKMGNFVTCQLDICTFISQIRMLVCVLGIKRDANHILSYVQ